MSSKFSMKKMKVAQTPKVCKETEEGPRFVPITVSLTQGWSLIGLIDFSDYNGTDPLTQTGPDTWIAAGLDDHGNTWSVIVTIPAGGGTVHSVVTIDVPNEGPWIGEADDDVYPGSPPWSPVSATPYAWSPGFITGTGAYTVNVT